MRPVNADNIRRQLEKRYKVATGEARKAYSLAIDDVCDASTLAVNKSLIELATKAAHQWYGTDTYHQASVIIQSLVDEIKLLGLIE